jgi:hypothetical protein
VCDLIEEACTFALEDTLPKVINHLLAENNGLLDFTTQYFFMDWESPSPAVVSENDWCLKMKGLFFD